MKRCSKCNEIKAFSEFNKRTNSKDGYRFECRTCQKLSFQKNRDHHIKKMKENSILKKDEYIKRDAKYYKNNRDKILEQKKGYNIKNKEVIAKKTKIYRKNNREKLLEINKKWVKNNIDYVREYHKNYSKEYREKYPYVILWRSILSSSLLRLGKKKQNKTIELLEYSALELKEYIEKQFTEGMSWNNYGEWHIDHIKDISTFDKDTHPSIVNALPNLRPLWATTKEINGIMHQGNLNRPKIFRKNVLDGSIKK